MPQTFDNFLEMKDKNEPTSTKKYIYVLPLGYDPQEKEAKKEVKKGGKGKREKEYRGVDMAIVEEFLQAFFGPLLLGPSSLLDLVERLEMQMVTFGQLLLTIRCALLPWGE